MNPLDSQFRMVATGPAGLGAEFTGLDAGAPAHSAPIVLDALDRHGVVVLRGQTLSPEQQIAFAGALGKLRVSFLSAMNVEAHPELLVVSNIVRDGKPIGLVDAGALWHTDGSYLPRPDLYTVLLAVQIPQRDGQPLGDTAFLSTGHAYDTLAPELRERLEGAQAIHSWSHHIEQKRRNNFNAPPAAADKPDVTHPVVRTHPRTGKRCLFVTEGHTRAIAGLEAAESDALLQALFTHLKRPEGIHRHRWAVGDLLIWDNCATQHLAINDYGDRPRRLHRAGIEGPVPV